MPSRKTQTRVYVAMLVTLGLGFILPPSVNLNHFRARLSESLSRSLGQKVSLQDVRLRLLPMPGFTFRRLQISDDGEFGAEPILQTAEEDGRSSVATLRLSSLWRGRFEIASISLTQASLNLARASDGHWNLERLIDRAAQVPSAPTSRKKPEVRARFPYIELKESRINFKIGPEKKPFALSDAEFALWLAAENRWNVRLKAIPLRTDESISDTGVIELSGSFDRAAEFSQTPFHFEVNWARPEVNAITRIARGHDPGWRGSVELNAEFKGTPVDFSARLDGGVDEFRRFDIARSSSLPLRFTCDQRFRAGIEDAGTLSDLEFSCKLPLDSGMLAADGELHPLGRSPDYSVRLFASEVPISILVRAMQRAKSTLPDDLSGEGFVSGDWSIDRTAADSPVAWKGSMTASNVVLRSQVLRRPLIFPETVEMRLEPPQEAARTVHKVEAVPSSSRAVIEPFTLNLGGAVQVSAVVDAEGYRMDVKGPVDWQRLLQAGKAIGLRPPDTDLKGSGVLTAQYSGAWNHFEPPVVSGQAQIRSATLSIRGFSEPLHATGGILKFDGAKFQAEQVEASFPRSGLTFIAGLSGTRQCTGHVICDVDFSLRIAELRETVLEQLLSIPSGITLPFLHSGQQFEAKWLLEIPANGTISAQHLRLHQFQARNISGQLELVAGKVLIHHWTADLFDGQHTGEWAFDFSDSIPRITGSGSVQHARMEAVSTALDEQIGKGVVDVQYRFTMAGRSVDQLAKSASGTGLFVWKNGLINGVHFDSSGAPPLSFSSWSGRFTVDKRNLKLEDTKMTSTGGVQQVSGEVGFNREWNLRFVRANGSGFVATGSLIKPAISNEPAKLAEAR